MMMKLVQASVAYVRQHKAAANRVRNSFFMREFFILSENGAYSLNDAVPCFRNTAGPGKSYFRKDSINRK